MDALVDESNQETVGLTVGGVYRLADHVPADWRKQLAETRATQAIPDAHTLFLARLGRAYGWQAVKDMLGDVSWQDARALVAAVDYLEDRQRAALIADLTTAVAACFDRDGNRRAQQIIKRLARED